MDHKVFCVVCIAILTGVLTSGCIGSIFEQECELPTIDGPQDSSREVMSELRSKWRDTYDRYNHLEEGGNGVRFGVVALRTSPPDPPYSPPEDEPQPSTTKYVDWRSIPLNQRPEVLHDLLCVSEWRREQIPTFTATAPYETDTGVGESIYNETLDVLRAEFFKQNLQKPPDWCCYVLYNGEFYAPATKEAVRIS